MNFQKLWQKGNHHAEYLVEPIQNAFYTPKKNSTIFKNSGSAERCTTKGCNWHIFCLKTFTIVTCLRPKVFQWKHVLEYQKLSVTNLFFDFFGNESYINAKRISFLEAIVYCSFRNLTFGVMCSGHMLSNLFFVAVSKLLLHSSWVAGNIKRLILHAKITMTVNNTW